MGEDSGIEWCDHTFNPFWGCRKVSPGCDNCYAETWAKRLGFTNLWDSPVRRLFGDSHWAEPLKWNRQAQAAGVRRRVFCASMADVFDNEAPDHERTRLWHLIEATPQLDWLLLTKRIGNAEHMMPIDWVAEGAPLNVWLGISVVNQREADRDVPKLVNIRCATRFLSCEPLLEPVDLSGLLGIWWNSTMKCYDGHDQKINRDVWGQPRLSWVIVGGESGPYARPFTLGWGKVLVQQCRAAGAACFVKQVGSNPVNREGQPCPHITDRKGGDINEWPAELRVREWPRSAA